MTLRETESVVSEEGNKILLHAITGGRREDVTMILRILGVDPNLKDAETGKYPIHVATEHNDVVIMKELLNCRAVPDAQDKYGQTALHIATRKDMGAAVELLLSKKADPNAEDKKGRTPLWHAAWYGDSPRAFKILVQHKVPGKDFINYRCHDAPMPTALWAAAASSCLTTAQALLAAGANPNVLDGRGSTILHKAAWPSAAKLTPLLLENDAAVSARDSEGKLPLHWAAAVGKTSIVNALLERMAEGGVDETDHCEGATALIRAVQKGSFPLVRCLTEKWKANSLLQDQSGNEAFYYACAYGHILIATYLLGLGADINKGNNDGNTPLHVAAKWGRFEMVRFLLQLGANRDARSSQEVPSMREPVTPAEIARGAGHEDIANMIEAFKMDDESVTWKVEMIEPRRTGS